MNVHNYKKVLLIGVLVLGLVPLVNTYLFPKAIKQLKGAVTKAGKPHFSTELWMKGTFQQSFEEYINDNIGVRPFFVRVRNQLAYSLFDEATARGVIRGKENYLYELNYLKAFNGVDFIGNDSIQARVKRIKNLQDTLSQLGKTLVVCLAPGKGSFYPEYFPEEHVSEPTQKTNYHHFSKTFDEMGVNTIDFNKWFLEMKDTCSCMLYPRYGIHWSDYGMMMAADSLIRYIEYIHNMDMPNLEVFDVKKSRRISEGDYDIASGMNLLFQLKTSPMCYAKYRYTSVSETTKPKVTVIADSFYWAMFNIGIGSSSFSYGGFWFYNKAIYPESYSSSVTVSDVDLAQKIDDTDVFILMSTEANLARFPFGFDHDATQVFFP